MSADGRQFILGLADELIVDLFAGGGGMSTAIEQSLGRHVDIAANHSDDATSMHRMNHPQTRHFIADVFEIDPRGVSQGRPVGLLHLSPDCTHFSQAKGGQARDTKIRGLSWVGLRWAGQVRPRVITLENVKQIRSWGPLVAKRDKETGRVLRLDGSIAELGQRVPVSEQFLIPDSKRAGRTWKRFINLLERLGYKVESKVLCAADFGAPTTRERLFLVARRDRSPIVWPAPTHFKSPARGQKRWRAAAECIDFSIPCPSIFGRKKDLADATLRRIARGLKRYVLDSADPFIVPATHQGADRVRSILDPLPTITAAHRGEQMLVIPHLQQVTQGGSEHDAAQPLKTITTAKGGEQALIAATMVQTGYGERAGQDPRSLDIEAPLGSVVAGGIKHAIVAANLLRQFGTSTGSPLADPVGTVMPDGGGKTAQVCAFLAQQNTARDGQSHPGRDARDPLSTIIGTGSHQNLVEASIAHSLSLEQETGALRVAAFLINYYGNGQALDLREPMDTITTKDRLALVTVWVKGYPYVVVDIGLRMLTPRELYKAQGFPADYIIERGHDGRRFSKSAQVKMVGNSVSPPPAVALLKANFNHELQAVAA